VIRYVCACGHGGVAPEGQPKACTKCGAVVTLGAIAKGHAPVLTLAYVQKAAKRYLGVGEDAPLLTDRQKDDRKRELRGVLDKLKVHKVAELKNGDFKRFMEAMGLH
jgi:hypothetical protein